MAAGGAWANDSTAGFPAGSPVLELRESEWVEMRRETLRIAPDRVSVDYLYHNHGEDDVVTLVAFPLPPLRAPGSDEMGDRAEYGDLSDAAFHLSIDGVATTPRLQSRAMRGAVDVTARLNALSLPLDPRAPETARAIAALDAPTRAANADLIDAGGPSWSLARIYYWQQRFPAGADVAVHHDYVPLPSVSFGGADYGAETADLAPFCIDDGFARAAARISQSQIALEYRLDYILRTGANWLGPIGRFELIVEKPHPGAILSLCAEGITKISPTEFRMVKEDFVPERDLSVLWLVPPSD